jgi:hypothetical protein
MLGHFFPLRKAARIGRVRRTAGLATIALCGSLFTQAAVADGTNAKTATPGAATSVSWAGLNWGLGIAADFDLHGTQVASASIVNGIVRVNDSSSNVGVSFVLEAHYFLRDYTFDFGGSMKGPGGCTAAAQNGFINVNCTEIAHGPFIAIEVGDGSTSTPAAAGPITAYALGWMVGLHHPKFDPTTGKPVADNTSWNLGVGLRVNPKGQILGDGFAANAAPPNGETAIRYKTEPEAGIMLLSSFSF